MPPPPSTIHLEREADMKRRISNLTLLAVFALLVAVLFGALSMQQDVALATDPSPQSVTQSKQLEWAAAGTEYTAATTSWSSTESAFYGVSDIYYTLAVASGDLVTMTLRHSPDCSTWKTFGSAASYTTTQAVTAGTVFTRVSNYGGCIGASLVQSDTATTTPVTVTFYTILKNN